MAIEPEPFMPKALVKAAVTHARSAPVNAAFAAGKDPKLAYLLLDRVKDSAALAKRVEKDGPGAFNTRHGTAYVPEDDPKLLRFKVNRAVSQMARRLIKSLKGTGITKVEIVLDDGTVVDSVAETDEEDGDVAAAPAAAEQPAPASDAPVAAAEAETVRLALSGIIGTLKTVIAAEPARKDGLLALAGKAQLQLKANDVAAAAATIAALRQSLATPSAGVAAKPKPAQAGPGGVGYAKSRLVWIKVRQSIEGDLARLREQIMLTYKDEAPDTVAAIETSYRSRTRPVLETLDEELADRLDEATNEADPAKRARLVEAARQAIGRYQSFVGSDPIIAALDKNPFMPLSIGSTLGVTLKTLSAALH